MMTISIANRVINIHTSAAVSILLFTIVTTWNVRNFTDQIRENNALMKQSISAISHINKKDSIYDVHFVGIESELSNLNGRFKNVHDTIVDIMKAKYKKPVWGTVHRKYPGGDYTLQND